MMRIVLPVFLTGLTVTGTLSLITAPPEPVPHGDGRIVTQAVEIAQARVDRTRAREYRK
jgi:hypothetical protein